MSLRNVDANHVATTDNLELYLLPALVALLADEAPEHFTLRIQWDSAEGHLQGFRKSPQLPPFLAAVRPFLGDIEEMRHYDLTAVRWVR